MPLFRRIAGIGAIVLGIASVAVWMLRSPMDSGPLVILALALAAVWCNLGPEIRTFAFSIWVFAAVAASMYYPFAFDTWGDLKLTRLISPLIQIIMFGVGTQLSVADFARTFKMPKPVLVGMVCQYTIMPSLGFLIARGMGFEGGIAAGIVLIGACPGGVASNVMCYIARANVALSVTLTAVSTMMAPLMTPLAMKVLANEYVAINFKDMMIDILWMIITPVVAGLIVNRLAHGKAVLLDKVLPLVSMITIIFIIAIITAGSRDKLLDVGVWLILAAMIHNTAGYLLGFWGAKLARLSAEDCRVVAIEVGMQNGGMGSALAINVLKNADAALAPAIFGPWMNISGSALASYWRRRPLPDSAPAREEAKGGETRRSAGGAAPDDRPR